MGLSKNITLTIKDYEIKLDKEIKFYENDTIDLCFSILEYGIEVKDGISINKLMPIQALRSYMLIETPHGIDYAESTKIEDNKIVFNLGTKYSQFVGIGRMQIVVKDSDGCRVTLPEFEFEIKESINMNWDRESFDFLATEDDSIIIDEFGRKIHMSKISDMPESENISEESYAMIIDEEGNKRFKVSAIVDAVEDSLDAKFNAYTDEINGDVEEFKGSVRTDITTLTNENNAFKNQVNISLANYGSDYNNFKDNVEARLGEHMTDYNRFKDGVETRIEESESTYDGFVSNVSTVLDNYGSTYNAFKSEVNTANASFRSTLNASNQAFKNEMVDRYDNFIYKIDEDIFEGGRTDYFGETHEKIGERLDLDFDVVHQRINDSGLMEYEGCSITANNTYYGRQKDTVIKGRTLQNCIKDVANLYHGVGSYNNKWITIQQKTDEDVGFSYSVENMLLKPDTVYTMFLDINENTILDKDSAYTYHFTLSKSGLGYGDFACNLNRVFGIGAGETGLFREKFTYREVVGNRGVKIGTGGFISKSSTENNGKIVFRIFILEGDHTQTPLEELPFIEGIESVGDKSKNLIDVSKFNPSDDKITIDGDCIVINEPTVMHPTLVDNLNIPLNGDYVFIPTVESGNYTGGNVILHFADGGKTEKPVTTPGHKYSFINQILTKITIYAPRGTARIKLFLLKGSDINTPYEPYYDYKISGKSIGKNLCNGEVINNLALNLDGSEVYSLYSQTLRYVKVKPNTNYIFSNVPNYSDRQAVIEYDKNKNAIGSCFVDSNYCFTTGHDTNYIAYYFYKGDFVTERSTDINLQLEEGTTATPYEPYKESNYSYILNEPLRSLPSGVCDEIDLTTGVLTRRVGKVVIDGSQKQWTLEIASPPIEGTLCFDNQRDFGLGKKFNYSDEPRMICDKFPSYSREGLANNKSGIAEYNGGFRIRIQTANLETEDVQGFIKWLSDNPITVYFELATPTAEQLTQQQLKSFDVTTHIISDNKLMPIVSTKIPTDLGAMVNTLSLRNRELEEVNEQQDELIDITMMATDEMYSMLEPLMEAVEPMGLLDCSKMAQMYVAMVRRGIKKIEDIPSRYQEEVREVLGIKIEEEEWGEDDGIK